MLKAFFRDSAVYGVAKLLTGGLTLLALPIYTHALRPGEYGVIELLTSIAAIAHVTVALEIAQGLARHVMSPEGEPQRQRYASTALWFTLAAYSVFVAIVMPFASRISMLLFYTEDRANVVRVAALVTWSTGLFYLLQNILRYSRKAPKYAIVSVVFSVTNIGVTLVLLLVLRAGIVAMFIGQFAAGLLAVVLGAWFARESLGAVFDRALWRQMLAFSIPLVPSGLGVMLCSYVDRFAIARLLTVTDLGLYSIAFRISAILVVVVACFDAALAPLIYQNHKEEALPAQLARMIQWFLALAIPLLLFLGLFSTVIVRVVAPPSYAGGAKLVFLLSAGILVANLYNFSPGLWIAKKTGWVAVISLSSGAMNLGLNFVLIPRLGLIGAALATLISAVTGGAAHFVFGGRFFPIPFNRSRLAIAAALTMAGGLVGSFVDLGLVLRAVCWLVLSVTIATLLLGLEDMGLIRDQIVKLLTRLRSRGGGRAG